MPIPYLPTSALVGISSLQALRHVDLSNCFSEIFDYPTIVYIIFFHPLET